VVISRGTPFPLLKCLRTHCGRHCEPFSSQKMQYIAGFCIYNLQFFGEYPAMGVHLYPLSGGESLDRTPRSAMGQPTPAPSGSPRCLDPDTNFRLARQRSRHVATLGQGAVAPLPRWMLCLPPKRPTCNFYTY